MQDKNALAFDLVNLRLLLEPGIAEIAAQNATPEDIERMQRLCDRVETKIRDGERYIEDDIAFHTCIAESSKNLVVGQLIPIIDTAVMMFVNVTHKKLIDETIMTHRMIVEAIARHDPLGARSAMVMHLNFNRTYIKKVYDGEDPDDGTIGMAAICKKMRNALHGKIHAGRFCCQNHLTTFLESESGNGKKGQKGHQIWMIYPRELGRVHDVSQSFFCKK